MELLHHSNKQLKETAKAFDFQNASIDPVLLAQDLVKFLYDNASICISAPQLGIPYRVFAMRGSPENFVCFNPRIVMASEDQVRLEEVSSTYPGLIVKVKRPQHCRVRFATPNGEVRTETYTGMTARVFQHCMDFLDGEVFYHKANPIHREQALKKWKK